MLIDAKFIFGSSSVGSAALSQAVIPENANNIRVDVIGIRRYSQELHLATWRISDVIVDAGPSPALITVESFDKNNTAKDSIISVDLTDDPTAQVIVTVSRVSIASEYSAPELFVVGPENEMNQYENPGQWYYDTTNSEISIYIP